MVEMAMFYDQRAITPKVTRVTVHVFCTSSRSALHLCEVFLTISQSVFNLQSRHEYMVEMALFNVRRPITPKVGKPELPFMCFAHHLVVLYFCVKFGDNIFDGMEWLKNDENPDRRTCTQNFGRYNIIPSPLFVARHRKVKQKFNLG